MTVNDWVLDAVKEAGPEGATLGWLQRYIDERRNEELAVDTIESALDVLVDEGRVEAVGEKRWAARQGTSKEDAVKRLFGE